MRLIDADAYIKYCEDNCVPLNEYAVKAQPTVDVTPVVHAKWVKKKHLIPLAWDSDPFIWENYDEETHSEWKEYWHCSECDYEADRSMKPKFKYCPECGAKMEGEK